jgi:predicted dehydrogenase
LDRVRIGVLGTGNIAPLNVTGYLEHPQCDIVAVCDNREEKARAAADSWGGARVYTDIEKFLADDDIDAVEVLTPTMLHTEHVIAALEAGKHVSCQKPIANSVADGRAMAEAARRTGRTLRIAECNFGYPPLVKAKELIREGVIGHPTMCRIKTVVANTDTEFQNGLDPAGYVWRFNKKSPGGHLFDDMVHKYGTGIWLFDETDITSVQAIVRQGPLFFEAPMAAIWEYERESLLGMMEVTYAPRMNIRSSFYGADEFFEIQGTDGFIWVTRCTGEMLDLAPLIVYHSDGTTTSYSNLESNWLEGFRRSSKNFIDALLEGRPDPEMTPEMAIKTLQFAFAVYQASIERAPVDPRTIDDAVSPPWWPPDLSHFLDDIEHYGEK